MQRELERLTRARIVNMSATEGGKRYQANRQSPIFGELYGLVLKTVGLVEPLRKSLKSLAPKINAAFVYGSIAKGTDTAKSDIDLMIIGNEIGYSDVYAALQSAEKSLARSVNPNVMSRIEWRKKLSDKNSFVTKVIQQPKLFVLGTDDELRGIEQSS